MMNRTVALKEIEETEGKGQFRDLTGVLLVNYLDIVAGSKFVGLNGGSGSRRISGARSGCLGSMDPSPTLIFQVFDIYRG